MISAYYYDKGDSAPAAQDALALEIVERRGRQAALIAVCGGIGAQEEGGYASGYVSMCLRDWFYDAYLNHIRRHHGRKRIQKDCCNMLYECNRYLTRYAEQYKTAPGTTMTMILVWKGKFLLFHAGDSRAYLIGRRCRRLTKDERAAGNAPCRRIGSCEWRGVSCRRGRLKKRKRLLVCSGGFLGETGEKELARSLGSREALTQGQLAKRLTKLGQAGRRRGTDRKAAVVIGYGEGLKKI